MANNTYDTSKNMLESIRLLIETSKKNRKCPIREEQEKKGKPIAITNDPKFGQNVLKNQINAFKQSVYLGAKFADENEEKPEENPLIYYPATGNLIFSGTIPTMANLKFQFSLNDSNSAPYIFVDGLSLTTENLTVLNKLCGYYQNWKEEFLTASDMLDSLGETQD